MTTSVRFDNVSFTYTPKGDRKRLEKAASEAKSMHDWGSHPEAFWALRDVSFEIGEGEFVGIAGHTGSGKSTLLQLAAGLMKPTKGSVFPGKVEPAEIGVVLQYPENQLFAETVFDDVAFGPRNLGLSSEEVEGRVRGALELLHLDADAVCQKSPFSLSGGQQRRVAIAGVLAMDPKTLILDEPTAGLDPHSHDTLLSLVCELHDRNGIAIMLVSHNMDDIAALCSRMLVLDRGSLVADGSPGEVFSSEKEMKRIGLGLPSTLRMAGSLGMDCNGKVPSLEQLACMIAEKVRHDS